MIEKILKRKRTDGKNQIIKIVCKDNALTYFWGIENGAVQETTTHYGPLNEGKANFISSNQNAFNNYERYIKEAKEKGYIESSENLDNISLEDYIKNNNSLPISLKFYKPQNSLSPLLEEAANESKDVLYTEKRDGMMFVFFKDLNGKLQIYSRTMLRSGDNDKIDWTERFDYLVEEFNKDFSALPKNTILLGEIVAALGPFDDDNRDYVSKVLNSNTQEAKELLKNKKLSYVIWDTAFYGGENYLLKPFLERNSWYSLIMAKKELVKHIWFVPVHVFKDLNEAKEYLKLHPKIEGFVVRRKLAIDMLTPKGFYGFVLSGEPRRPSHVGKLKLENEDDFIVRWNPDQGIGEFRTGEKEKGVGSVFLYQLNKDKQEVFICKCGGGLTEKDRMELANSSLYPQVWQVTYNNRKYLSFGDVSNALEFPRKKLIRTDKKVEECINNLL